MILYLVRHGISIANEEGIILSDPINGVSSYGLSEQGRIALSVSLSGHDIPQSSPIYCSDFLRTRETAEMIKTTLDLKNEIIPDQRLRERYFGLLEMKSNRYYKDVWVHDRSNPGSSVYEVETLSDLKNRLVNFLDDIRRNHQDDESVVIVSHGDPLHVMYTIINGRPLNTHSLIDHWKPGEIRKFIT